MPNEKKNKEEIEQVQPTEEVEVSEQKTPTQPKRSTPRKKKSVPTSKPQEPGAVDNKQEDASEKEAEKEAEPQEEAATKKTSSRKKAAGTRKPAAKKKTKDTDAAPSEDGQASAAQETNAPTAPEQTPSVPLLEPPSDNLPVEAPPQDVGPARPPIDLSSLTRERKNFWGRLILLLATGVVLGLSVLIFLYRPTVYSARTHSIRFLYHATKDETQVIYDGEPCDMVLPGELTGRMNDATGSVCAAAVGGRLYLVQGDEVEEISPTVQDFQLSQNGRVLVYRNAENQLHYVELTGGSERYTVSRDCRDERYCLSPDGEMLFYTYVNTNAPGEKTHAAVFSISGEKPFFAETTGIIPVAIADDFEHIFYYDQSGDLYYMNADSEVSLCRRRGEESMVLLFDREFEELLLQDAKGMMLWQDGKETMLSQLKGGEILTLMPNQRAEIRTLPWATQCLIDSFDDEYYLKKGADTDGLRLSYLDAGKLSEVAFINQSESRPVVTDKGVYYLERVETQADVRKHLYFCPLGETEPVRLSWDVEDFCVNSDGSRILHRDHQGALYAAKLSGTHLESELISDYVDSALLDSNATDIFYYFVDGALFASDNGDKPDEALSALIDEVALDAHTAFFFDVQEDGTLTVYTKHRNRSKLLQVATGVTSAR